MSKFLIALTLPLPLLTGLSVFSLESFTARQYQLDAEREIVATRDTNEQPIKPGDPRKDSSAAQS